MSLIDNYMEPCTIINAISESDGEGGLITTWKDGAQISAAITHDSTMQARIAEADGINTTYTITTRRDVVLAFHQVIRRESDKQIFRVTSNGSDRKTPNVAGLDMCQVSAERWALPR